MSKPQYTATGKTHRVTDCLEYGIWATMKQRCQNPNDKKYPGYGGRGITVCERWQNFSAFLEDMGPRPSNEHCLERIDNDDGYHPANCQWAHRSVQYRNQRKTIRLTHNGETLTIKEWCARLGVKYNLIYTRVEMGWDAKRILETPSRPRKPSHRRNSSNTE